MRGGTLSHAVQLWTSFSGHEMAVPLKRGIVCSGAATQRTVSIKMFPAGTTVQRKQARCRSVHPQRTLRMGYRYLLPAWKLRKPVVAMPPVFPLSGLPTMIFGQRQGFMLFVEGALRLCRDSCGHVASRSGWEQGLSFHEVNLPFGQVFGLIRVRREL